MRPFHATTVDKRVSNKQSRGGKKLPRSCFEALFNTKSVWFLRNFRTTLPLPVLQFQDVDLEKRLTTNKLGVTVHLLRTETPTLRKKKVPECRARKESIRGQK
jgi:hypothetical protein